MTHRSNPSPLSPRLLSLTIHHPRGPFTLDAELETESPVTALLGPSGAGKSTLLHILAGLARPARGRVSLDGGLLLDTASGIDVPPHRRRVGMVFQEPRLFPHMNIVRNLEYGLAARPESERRFRTPEVAELLELTPLLRRSPHEISGGERQRVALGRALLGSPRLLLLDEPLSSLDAMLKQQVLPFLDRLHAFAGIPIIYVSHDPRELLRLTDDVRVIDSGRLRGRASPLELLQDPATAPILRLHGLGNVLTAKVVGHHAEEGVSSLSLGPASVELSAPLVSAANAGGSVRINIRPGDIALAPPGERIAGVTIQNQLPARVVSLRPHESGVDVDIDLPGGVRLVAAITRRAAASLGLCPGKPVLCLIKTQSIERL